jgi:hypothetical protein
MTFYFLAFFILYVAFAIFFIRSTWKASSKLQRRLVIAFFVLLPSWDMVLGYIVYYAALPFIPKVVIYETAETDGIYYEGDYRNSILISKDANGKEAADVLFADRDFFKGYQYVESLITSIEKGSIYQDLVSPPAAYRCVPITKDPHRPDLFPMHCSPTENIKSEYVVQVKRFKFARNEMNFLTIYNRSTGRLMGEYREVTRVGYDFIPFFIWLHWSEGGGQRYSRPEKSRLFDFQYDVLKPKK